MQSKSNYYYIATGVFRAFIISLIGILIYSIIITFKSLSENLTCVYILVLSLLAIVYGAVYASKNIKNKGWFVGLIVATIYMIIIYGVSVVAGRDIALNMRDMLRIISAILVGLLSGMLGVNI